jgi:hypothetical protein
MRADHPSSTLVAPLHDSPHYIVISMLIALVVNYVYKAKATFCIPNTIPTLHILVLSLHYVLLTTSWLSILFLYVSHHFQFS